MKKVLVNSTNSVLLMHDDNGKLCGYVDRPSHFNEAQWQAMFRDCESLWLGNTAPANSEGKQVWECVEDAYFLGRTHKEQETHGAKPLEGWEVADVLLPIVKDIEQAPAPSPTQYSPSENLIEKALRQIEEDSANGDYTAIAELLEACPVEVLQNFLSE